MRTLNNSLLWSYAAMAFSLARLTVCPRKAVDHADSVEVMRSNVEERPFIVDSFSSQT